MGQYFKIVNVDKRQYLHPHRFGCGLKLMEFANSSLGPQSALVILLADGNGRGGGDLHIPEGAPDAELVGSWAGDRIVVAGDYADPGNFIPKRLLRPSAPELTLNRLASEKFEDISDRIMRLVALCEAGYGHPWAATGSEDDIWRQVPEWGVLPEKKPEEPLAGKEAWEMFTRHAVSAGDALLTQIISHVRRFPQERELLLSKIHDQLLESATQ